MRRALALLAIAVPVAAPAQLLHVDARAPVAPPTPSPVPLGTARAPDGSTIGMNSRFVTLDGKPWLPVMGEFHYVRTPAAEWDRDLARIKASGVDIVSTYLIWTYHESKDGQFDWSGDRDLRRFVQAAARHGLKVWLRLGPWVHAEVRYGGLPDWVVRSMPTRRNDPAYMAAVGRFWGETAKQVHGLLWKDGGPIIGIQLENEYNDGGEGGGSAHVAALKTMAVRLGFDVPFYSVTGWNRAIYPADQVLAVYGGYPDEPWGRTTTPLPPSEVYAFRFGSRVGGGDLGAVTAGSRRTATVSRDDVPFIGVEYGGGVPTMYRRRPVIAPDDIAAMLPVQLGSGVNLYGYYMYHGGRNAIGATTLEESTAIGGYNDLPAIDYDFQAPFGEFGDANPTLAAIRPFHLFLQSWGGMLAPMAVRRPDAVPSGPKDLATPRFSVRSSGDAGFLFFNNHVRQFGLPTRPAVQFAVDLPGGTLRFPDRPVAIPDGAYFIWPINLPTAAGVVAWATVQPLTRLNTRAGSVTVFHAIDGVRASMAIRAAGVSSARGRVRRVGDLWVIDDIAPGTNATIEVRGLDGKRERYLVLSAAQAQQASRLGDRLLLTDDEVTPGENGLTLVSHGDPHLGLALFPAPASLIGLPAGNRRRQDGVFTRWDVRLPSKALPVIVTALRSARQVPALKQGGPSGTTVEPFPETWTNAAAWTLTMPTGALQQVSDATLTIDWVGDMARLLSGSDLLDDRFFDGRLWRLKLRRFADQLDRPLTLAVLPMPVKAPVYLDDEARAKLDQTAQSVKVPNVTIDADYQVTVAFES